MLIHHRAQMFIHPRQSLRPHFRRVDMALTGVDDALECVSPAVEAIDRAYGGFDDTNAIHGRAGVLVTRLEQHRPRRNQRDFC